MKKLILLSLLLLLPLLLLSCDEAETPEEEPPANTGVQMTAKILAMGDKIEVEVLESPYADGVYHVITSDATTYLNKDGQTIAKSDLALGDTVIISYSGQVMMSIPPQIVATKIALQ